MNLAAATVSRAAAAEALGVLAADVDVERVAEREVGREGLLHDGVDDHRHAPPVTGAPSSASPAEPGTGRPRADIPRSG